MRGGQGRQPLDVPSMEGLGNTACSLECLACLNHVHGWTIGVVTVPCLSNPAFQHRIAQQVARRRVRLDLDLGIIEQQLNQSSNQLGSQAFITVVMHLPVTGLFRVLPGSVSSSHHPSPLPRATYDGILNRLSIQHCKCME